MDNITITIVAPEFTAAINKLAEAMLQSRSATEVTITSPQPVPTAPPAAPAAPGAAPKPAPTAQQTYTLDQLALAATPLIDAGKQDELVALLAQFNVQAVTGLPKDQYGAFATALRGMGAKI